ncbi:MAG: hypothetical protein JO069_06675 [Verrucomicrobia bacterium]|nr:hypothetical protein [Verrucomicrobiota bacterium]
MTTVVVVLDVGGATGSVTVVRRTVVVLVVGGVEGVLTTSVLHATKRTGKVNKRTIRDMC